MISRCELCGFPTEELARDPNEELIWVCRDCAETMYDHNTPIDEILDAAYYNEVYRDD